MNWFVHSYPSVLKVIDDSACEHVEADMSKCSVVVTEMDSFGKVGEVALCADCMKKCDEEEGKEEVYCGDCKQTVLKSASREWRWYDFYAPQGDEPLIICKECLIKPKHIMRVKQDAFDREEEMSSYLGD